MKKVFIILISILLAITIIKEYNERNIEKDDKKRENVTTPISEEISKTDENRESKEEKETENKQEEIISQKIELNDIPVEHEEKTPEQPKQKKEPISESNKNNSNSTKTETKTKSTKNDSEKKEVKNVVEEKKEIESGTVDSSGNEVKEEPKKTIVKEPWEQLGISKEDYENKPLYSWMRVDYNVSNCGSVNNCEALCMSDSEELSYTENVSCIQVYSHSGKYLGEMLKRN